MIHGSEISYDTKHLDKRWDNFCVAPIRPRLDQLEDHNRRPRVEQLDDIQPQPDSVPVLAGVQDDRAPQEESLTVEIWISHYFY